MSFRLNNKTINDGDPVRLNGQLVTTGIRINGNLVYTAKKPSKAEIAQRVYD